MPAFLERRPWQQVACLVDKLQFGEYSDARQQRHGMIAMHDLVVAAAAATLKVSELARCASQLYRPTSGRCGGVQLVAVS